MLKAAVAHVFLVLLLMGVGLTPGGVAQSPVDPLGMSPAGSEAPPQVACTLRQLVVAEGADVAFDGSACLADSEVHHVAQGASTTLWFNGATAANACGILLWAQPASDFVAVPCWPETAAALPATLADACGDLDLSLFSAAILCAQPTAAAAACPLDSLLASLLGSLSPQANIEVPCVGDFPTPENPCSPLAECIPDVDDLCGGATRAAISVPCVGDVPIPENPCNPAASCIPETCPTLRAVPGLCGTPLPCSPASECVPPTCPTLRLVPGFCGEPLPSDDPCDYLPSLFSSHANINLPCGGSIDECDYIGGVPSQCGTPLPCSPASECVPPTCPTLRAVPGFCGTPLPSDDPCDYLPSIFSSQANINLPCGGSIDECDYLGSVPGQCGEPMPSDDPCDYVPSIFAPQANINLPCGNEIDECDYIGTNVPGQCGEPMPSDDPCDYIPRLFSQSANIALPCGNEIDECDYLGTNVPGQCGEPPLTCHTILDMAGIIARDDCVPDHCDFLGKQGGPVSCGGDPEPCEGTRVALLLGGLVLCAPDHCEYATGPVSCESDCEGGLAQAAGPLGTFVCIPDPCGQVDSNAPLLVCQDECRNPQILALPDGLPVCIPSECDYLSSPAREMVCADDEGDCQGSAAVAVAGRIVCVPDHCTYVPGGVAYDVTCGCEGGPSELDAAAAAGGPCTDPCVVLLVILKALTPDTGPCPPSTDPCDNYDLLLMLFAGPDPNPFGCPPPTDPCAYYDYATGSSPLVLPQAQEPPGCPPSTDPCYWYHYAMAFVPHPSGGPLPCPPPTEPCAYHAYASSYVDASIPGVDPGCPPDPCYTYGYAAGAVPNGLLYYKQGGPAGVNLYGKTVGDCVPDPIDLLCYYYAKGMATLGSLGQVTAASGPQDRAALVDGIPPACIPDQCTTTLAPYWHRAFTNQPCKVPDPCRDVPVSLALPTTMNPCGRKPTDIACDAAPTVCVTYNVNGQTKRAPLEVPAVFFADEKTTAAMTAQLTSSLNCQYDIVNNMPVVHPCPAALTSATTMLPTNVLAITWFIGAPAGAATAGTFIVVPNPLYLNVLTASVTMPPVLSGQTIGTVIQAGATFAMVSGTVVFDVAGTKADAEIDFVAPRSTGSASVFFTAGSETVFVTQGSPNSGGGLPAGWHASLHYEQVTGVHTVTANWDSTVVADLTFELAKKASIRIVDMPVAVDGIRAEISNSGDVGHFRLHWPGPTHVPAVYVTAGQNTILIQNPPDVFDVSLDIADQDQGGIDWKIIDFLLTGTRTSPGTFSMTLTLAGITASLHGLSDNLQAHLEFEKDLAATAIAGLDASTQEIPRLRVKISDPTGAANAFVQSIQVNIPGKAAVDIQKVSLVDIDTTLGEAGAGYKVGFGDGGKVLVQTFGSNAATIDFTASGVTLEGKISVTAAEGSGAVVFDLTATGSTSTIRLSITMGGKPPIVITALQKLDLSAEWSGEVVDFNIEAAFGQGTITLAVDKLSLDIQGLQELAGNGHLDLDNLVKSKLDLAWRITDPGQIVFKYSDYELSIRPGTETTWDCQLTFPFSCARVTTYGDVVTFPAAWLKVLCDVDDIHEKVVLDRSGDEESMCFGRIHLATIGTGAATGALQSALQNGYALQLLLLQLAEELSQ